MEREQKKEDEVELLYSLLTEGKALEQFNNPQLTSKRTLKGSDWPTSDLNQVLVQNHIYATLFFTKVK